MPLTGGNIYNRREGRLDEPWQAAAHHDVGASQIDVEHELPVRNPDIEHRPVNNDAGGIHDAVDTAHCSGTLLNRTRD
jgi:hypothetical protein